MLGVGLKRGRIVSLRDKAAVNIDRLDHLVLTVSDLDATARFYTQVLGTEELTFGAGRKALWFGDSKINLHQHGHEFEPKAHRFSNYGAGQED